jgi:hypothetical protein
MDFRDARHSARMTVIDVAEYLNISVSTVKRYDRTGKAPKSVIECLRMIAGYFPNIALPRNGFEGWRMRGGYLWSPGGDRFTSGDVLASRLNQELVDSLHRSNVYLRQEMNASNKRVSNIIEVDFRRNKSGHCA